MCQSILRPIHQHDCRGCQLVGSFDGKDVYQCDHIDLCVRWGDSEEENKSLPISLVARNPDSYGDDWRKAIELYVEKYSPSPLR